MGHPVPPFRELLTWTSFSEPETSHGHEALLRSSCMCGSASFVKSVGAEAFRCMH